VLRAECAFVDASDGPTLREVRTDGIDSSMLGGMETFSERLRVRARQLRLCR
jgi:hypothetical protein